MKKRVVIYALGIGLVAWGAISLGQRLLKPAADCVTAPLGSVVSADEIERFVSTWQNYQTQDFVLEDTSLHAENAKDYPLRLRWWLARHCFTPERFFEAEDKIRSTVHALYLREHANAVIEILNAELETEKDEQRQAAFQNMIEAQKKIADAFQISEEQMEAVASKLPEIRALWEAQK